MKCNGNIYGVLLRGAACWLLTAIAALAQVSGTIITTDGREVTGPIVWKGGAKRVYEIGVRGTTLSLKPESVRSISVKKPDRLDEVIRNLDSGRLSNADMDYLKKVIAEMTMLGHDVPAAAALARAQVANNQAKEAVVVCEGVLANYTGANRPAEVLAAYWDALVASGNESKLRAQIESAVSSGSREMAAVAQIKRGDLDMKIGNHKQALIDGYLRTVVFFKDVEAAQPEALYKAFKCFAAMGMNSRAEAMKRKLLTEYPAHRLAQKAQSEATM